MPVRREDFQDTRQGNKEQKPVHLTRSARRNATPREHPKIQVISARAGSRGRAHCEELMKRHTTSMLAGVVLATRHRRHKACWVPASKRGPPCARRANECAA